jgi:hypothetical protein
MNATTIDKPHSDKKTNQQFLTSFYHISQGFQNLGVRPSGDFVGPLRGAGCLYEGHIYFERNMGEDKIYIFVGTLLG